MTSASVKKSYGIPSALGQRRTREVKIPISFLMIGKLKFPIHLFHSDFDTRTALTAYSTSSVSAAVSTLLSVLRSVLDILFFPANYKRDRQLRSGSRLAAAWQPPGSRLAAAWQPPGSRLTVTWQPPDSHLRSILTFHSASLVSLFVDSLLSGFQLRIIVFVVDVCGSFGKSV